MPIKKIKRGYRKTRYIFYKETLIDFKEHFWSFIGSFFRNWNYCLPASTNLTHIRCSFSNWVFRSLECFGLWSHSKSVSTASKFSGWSFSFGNNWGNRAKMYSRFFMDFCTVSRFIIHCFYADY